ncbi:MAG: ATP synthase subunit I [Methylococcaceae bacterium]
MINLSIVFLSGVLLGGLFFGGLWWTVKRSINSAQPALWFFSSWLIRTGLVLSGFYVLSAQDWQRLLSCLLGFIIARFIVIKLTDKAPQAN